MRLFDEEESSEDVVDEGERQSIRDGAREWAKSLGAVREDYQLRRRLAWRPHLYCPGERVAIHIMLYPRVAATTVDACKAAKGKVPGLRIVWAGPERFMRVPGVLDSAAIAGSGLVFLREGRRGKAGTYATVVEAVYGEGLIVNGDLYRTLARSAFQTAMSAPRAAKGRLLEVLIAFIVSQVPGFRIVETNYNTATEEIDVVVENKRIDGMFRQYSGPLLLAEAKNWTGKAGKNEYVGLATKIRNRRRSVSVGLFVSIGGYTQDFRLESLRDSREHFVVARFDRSKLEAWIEACGEDAAALVEERIRAAALE